MRAPSSARVRDVSVLGVPSLTRRATRVDLSRKRERGWFASLTGRPASPFARQTDRQASIDQSKALIDQPKALIDQPKVLIDQSKALIDQPKVLIDQPRALIDQPRALIDQPRLPIDQRETLVAEQSIAIDPTKTAIDRRSRQDIGTFVRSAARA